MHTSPQSLTSNRALTPKEVAALLSVSEKSVRDARWRRRAGLGAVRVGASLRFLTSECYALLERGQERLPMQGAPENAAAKEGLVTPAPMTTSKREAAQ